MARTVTTVFNRVARREWRCQKCWRVIRKGVSYFDIEHKTYTNNGAIVIEHERHCYICENYRKDEVLREIGDKEPVAYNGTKERLIGVGYDDNHELKLITEEWKGGKKHFRDMVYDWNGSTIRPDNVQFVACRTFEYENNITDEVLRLSEVKNE